jgi:heme-degrading monooxygenase HmoA
MIAQTPTPPYYAVIFVSTLQEGKDGYPEMSRKMVELSKTMPGFLGIESVRTDMGITVCYWKDQASIKHWYDNAVHKEAQRLGRSEWFKSLRIRVAKVEKDYGFEN